MSTTNPAHTFTRMVHAIDAIAEARRSGIGAKTSTVLSTIDAQGISNRSTRFTASDNVQPKGRAPDDARAELERSWVVLGALIRKRDELAVATISHPHPALGPLSLYTWIAFAGAHEARHMQEIRERLGV
jgi:hypothetical protein